MADLEIHAQDIIPIDSDYADVSYEKDDGSISIYQLSTVEKLVWSIGWEILTSAEYTTIKGLWDTKKRSTSFSWLHADGSTYNVRFHEKPVLKMHGGTLYSGSAKFRKIS